jgi:hypothetical protein
MSLSRSARGSTPTPRPRCSIAETEAARRARDPLGPATRATVERHDEVDDVEAVKRLIDPTRRRRPRQP